MRRTDIADAAGQMRRLLAAVWDGTLDASGPLGAALVRRLEGALAALDAAIGRRPDGPDDAE